MIALTNCVCAINDRKENNGSNEAEQDAISTWCVSFVLEWRNNSIYMELYIFHTHAKKVHAMLFNHNVRPFFISYLSEF